MNGVVAWKPIPDDGMCVYERERTLYGDSPSGAYVRPPEPVYEPGDTNVRVTPAPRDLLMGAMAGG